MIDAIRSYHSPLYLQDRRRGLSKSLYWGIGLAVLLHVLLAWYLIHQTFSTPPTEAPLPEQSSTVISMERPAPPPQRPEPPANPIRPHESPLPPQPAQQTLPLDPQVKPVVTTAQPPSVVVAQSSTSAGTALSSAPVYVTPRWTRFPDGNALATYYPPRAIDNEIEGVSTVECTVMDDKGRVTCQAISETPAGYGFGSATARMVQERGRVDTSQGDVKVGSKLRTTVKWTLG